MSSLKRIAIVTTGGTIAASATSQTTLGDYQVDQSAQQLIQAIPELEQIAHLEVYEVCHIDSRNMTFPLQHQLITQVQQLVARADLDGVVVTHGTDTLEETALLMQWCVKSTKPVVLTGAMRPASALSADGALNLFNAVLVASHPEAQGVGALVVLNDTVHSARFVQKTHTSVPDAFSSPAMGPVGLISQGKVYINAMPRRPFGSQSALHLPVQPQLPQVDIVFDYVGASSAVYKACVQAGSRAVIIATLGNGSLSPAARDGARYCHEHGVLGVRASRIGNGAVSPSEQDTQWHTLPAHQLHAVAARTLVALALAQQASRDELAYYLEYY